MTVEFLDPRADPEMPVAPYMLSVDLAGGPIDVGLLANGFPDSVAFLDHVEEVLVGLLPEARFRRYNKGNASVVASDQLLDDITARCGAVVTAYGH